MCTAVQWGQFFGRNLDLDRGFGEQVVITPRHFPLKFRSGYGLPHHYAMIGMAVIASEYPLYFEAVNERGLAIAGLNFPGNAVYLPKKADMDNIAPYELIPWILGRCTSVAEAKVLLQRMNVWNLPFSRAYPLSPLHWMITDGNTSLVAEPTAQGLQLYENPVGVLTNNPPFPYHMLHLADYMNLSADPAENRFGADVNAYSAGMGAMGLPGDFSSASRFVKAAFVRKNSTDGGVRHFFHILSSVAMPKGSVILENGAPEYTRYACCCDLREGMYYYATYDSARVRAVGLRKADLTGDHLQAFSPIEQMDVFVQN